MKHLLKIGLTFYFRRRTPLFIRNLLDKAFVKLSLHTKNKEHAEMLGLKLDNLFEELTLGLRLKLIEPQQALEQLKQAGVCDNEPRSRQPMQLAKKKIVIASRGMALEPISKLFQRYKAERLASGKWIEKTALENQRCFDLLLTVVGDLAPDNYSHQTLMEFRDVLQKLPPNVNTCPRTRGKSLPAVLKMQHSRLLSASQVNKYLVCVSAFFAWLWQHEVIPVNPAHHLLISRAKIRPDEERLAYSVDEVKAMLAELLQQKVSFGINQSRFWVPAIAAYSGARLTEICQLHLSDVCLIDGIWCFDINEQSDKRLKNYSSARVFPVHPSLIVMGLLDYVEYMRLSGNNRLFPELSKEKYHGYGRQMSKWFTSFNRKYISSDKRKTFHSIRHSVANELKQSGVAVELISEILGHKVDSITMSRYGKKYRPELLLEALKRLPW